MASKKKISIKERCSIYTKETIVSEKSPDSTRLHAHHSDRHSRSPPLKGGPPPRNFLEQDDTDDESHGNTPEPQRGSEHKVHDDVGEASRGPSYASRAQVETINRKFREMNAKMDKMETGLNGQIKSLKKQMDEKDERIKKLEDERDQMQSEHDKQQTEHTSQIAKLKEENEDLQYKITQLLGIQDNLPSVEPIRTPRSWSRGRQENRYDIRQLQAENARQQQRIEQLEKRNIKLENPRAQSMLSSRVDSLGIRQQYSDAQEDSPRRLASRQQYRHGREGSPRRQHHK